MIRARQSVCTNRLDVYLVRRSCARAVSQWTAALRDRSGWQKAAVALANKNARILWAIMTKGEAFDARHVSTQPKAPASTSTSSAQPAMTSA